MILSFCLIPAVSFAKIEDFNALIKENAKAQEDLHTDLKKNMKQTRDVVAEQKKRERIVVVENSGASYNAPTRKGFLAFKKEGSQHKASEKKQFERLANEVNSLGE